VFVLPAPIPPVKHIHHKYKPAPSLPRDIYIERWLPHKRSRPSKLHVIPAPPFNPEPVQDEIITHYYAPARVQYEIHKNPQPRQENPYIYEQQHFGTLLDKYKLQQILFNELTQQRAAQLIFQRLEAIFRHNRHFTNDGYSLFKCLTRNKCSQNEP
ncbi:unnamed protein product, partial [Rotaria sp. Silwood1]